ncbi:Otoferlin [Eumeta japonica]|uniref:Otoferlin n=1 Tax=Eumeta variegata TaxID=151549 RepID=A0A4C1ZJT5_EUMVA|nr:Otoferlin [Eumeta japonica]
MDCTDLKESTKSDINWTRSKTQSAVPKSIVADHQVYHKWAQLLQPKDQTVGAVGYLKVDIAILFRGEPQHIPETVHNSNIEENLLLPSSSVQQRANFVVTIYNAYALPSGSRCFGDRRYGRAPDTFVKVTFAGLTAKTAVHSRDSNPAYNEQISMVEMFPNMSQDVHIEVCSGNGPAKKVICGTFLRLGEISDDGENGFLPTFGPSLLPMYGTSCSPSVQSAARDGPYYKGSLLVALSTQVPYYLQGLRTAKTSSTAPLHLVTYGFYLLIQIKKIVGNSCAVAITMGEVPMNKKYDAESKKLYSTGPIEVKRTHPPYGHLEFAYAYPVLELATRLPDFRFRMYRNNMVYGIFLSLETIYHSITNAFKSSANTSVTTSKKSKQKIGRKMDGAGCFCIAAKVELLLWMGLYNERSYFPQELPGGYRVKTKDVDMCVKANDMTKWKTLTPIWNQVLKIRAKIFSSSERLNSYTPIVIVEVYDRDSGVKDQSFPFCWQCAPPGVFWKILQSVNAKDIVNGSVKRIERNCIVPPS